MLYRHICAALLTIFLTLPAAAAWERGNVLLENRSQSPHSLSVYRDLWVHFGWRYALAAGAVPLNLKPVPYYHDGQFIAPAPNRIVFHYQKTVSWWDGVDRESRGDADDTLPYSEIFTADTELTEIAPMRSGNYLVAERWNDATRGAKLIEFNLRGRVAEHRFPTIIDPETNRALGAQHIELLSDQCTVLYTLGNDHRLNNRVLRMNICTGQQQADFATLLAGEYAGAIRQLSNGDVLVANGAAIMKFNAQGAYVGGYVLPGVTHIALSPDATTLWAAGVSFGQLHLQGFDLRGPSAVGAPVQIGNDGMQTSLVPLNVTELVVVGEGRASAAVQKAPRRRAVTH